MRVWTFAVNAVAYSVGTALSARTGCALADGRCEEEVESSGALCHLDVRLADYVRPNRFVCVEGLP